MAKVGNLITLQVHSGHRELEVEDSLVLPCGAYGSCLCVCICKHLKILIDPKRLFESNKVNLDQSTDRIKRLAPDGSMGADGCGLRGS